MMNQSEGLIPEPDGADAGNSDALSSLRQRLTGHSEADQQRLLLNLVLEHATASLRGRPSAAVEADRPFTGRLALDTHPWPADHAVQGAVLLPGTAFVDLAIRAGDQVGCDLVEELTLETPLLLPEHGGVQLQIVVRGADENGSRSLSLHSRIEGAPADEPWSRHATGVLTAGAAAAGFDLAAWPPADARPVDVRQIHADLAEAGFGYGPAFQGLRAAWLRGTEILAEIALPAAAEDEADRFGLHPALLDAALHALGADTRDDALRGGLPFAWSGVTLHATGASTLRVRITPLGAAEVALDLADGTGRPVMSVRSLALREISAEQLGAARGAHHESLFRVEWAPLPRTAGAVEHGRWAALDGGLDGLAAESFADLAEVASAEVVPEVVFASCASTGAGASASVTEELDRLEAALAASTADGVTRARVQMRLQALAARWSESPQPGSASVSDTPDDLLDVDHLDAASDEELFAFIDDSLA